jgi:hypothetical protein
VGSANTPFVVTASAGPQAGSHIDATVTRMIGKASVTLPGALVPALEPGDVVDVDFPDYRRPPSTVNYHVNVAFITETARQHWLFERSSSADQLFSNGRRRKSRPASPSGQNTPSRELRLRHRLSDDARDRNCPADGGASLCPNGDSDRLTNRVGYDAGTGRYTDPGSDTRHHSCNALVGGNRHADR